MNKSALVLPDLWGGLGSVLGRSWVGLGVVLGRFWDGLGVILGQSGVILGRPMIEDRFFQMRLKKAG